MNLFAQKLLERFVVYLETHPEILDQLIEALVKELMKRFNEQTNK